jgi:hypothetical protein
VAIRPRWFLEAPEDRNGPLDKDDAVPRVRKADGGKLRAARLAFGILKSLDSVFGCRLENLCAIN